MQLKDFGAAAQRRLRSAKVLMVGAGGLGCPALLYLAGAGVGTIGIADHDVVKLHNLHRQVLYITEDSGKPKVQAAAQRLQQLNPEIQILTHDVCITHKEALSVFSTYDIIIDGTDNFATRFMINDACMLLKKPLIYGAVAQTEGQVGIFTMQEGISSINYRNLFPDVLPEEAGLSCNEQGVLGMIPGIIGLMMATETIKLITQKGSPLIHQVLFYNCFTNRFFKMDISATASHPSTGPQTFEAFENTDYYKHSAEKVSWKAVNGNQAAQILQHEHAVLIDIRDEYEPVDIAHKQYLHIPMHAIHTSQQQLAAFTHIIVACSGGVRSKAAAQWLSHIWGDDKHIYSLSGGMQQWEDHIKIFS
jgi:adenylyltransferase/sulfurtransferase